MIVQCLKYRILPTKAQENALKRTLEICRDVYNSLLNERTALYQTHGSTLSRNQQNKHLTQWKAANPELYDVHSQVLQNIAQRVDLAFKAFFRRIQAGEKPGYPRFKGQGTYDSITYPQAPFGCKLQGETLTLSKIGDVKCIVHRALIGTPKTCTVRRQAGKWFACFACEYEPEPLPPSEQSVGVDVGLEKFAALSDGSFVDNPRFFRKDEKALAKAGRKQAKTARRSAARRKANKVLSRIHERIRNRRHDFVHQFARRLVNRYGIIAVEKLNVAGMVKNPCLAKSISDASWSMFRAILTQKAESAARQVAEVNPAYTSQDCCVCGFRAKKSLQKRWHFCPVCFLSLDRDTNAAVNILQSVQRVERAQPAVGLHSVAGMPA